MNTITPGELYRFRDRCRSCRAAIVWAATDLGGTMPVDGDPAANGNVMLKVADGALVAGVFNRQDAKRKRAVGFELYTSHFVTCPNAATHRRR